MKCRSNIGKIEYNIKDVCRIINPKQQKLYIKNGVYPVDIYVSLDQENKDIVVMCFDKVNSEEVYKKWCNYELE